MIVSKLVLSSPRVQGPGQDVPDNVLRTTLGLAIVAFETSSKVGMVCRRCISLHLWIMAFEAFSVILYIDVYFRTVFDRWTIHAEVVAIGASRR